MKIHIQVVEGPDKGTGHTFTHPDRFLIGRSSMAHFQLSSIDKYVSRRHCLLELSSSVCYIHHLSMTNPTYVNGIPVIKEKLRHLDVIRIGNTSLQIQIENLENSELYSCKNCGNYMFAPGSLQPLLCVNCVIIPSLAQTSPREPRKFRCYMCEKDLSEFANNDGKAKELWRKVHYSCRECLPAKESLRDKMIGEYEIIQRLADGSMGRVFLVFDPNTSRLVVLKTISEIKSKKELIAHFKREIKVHQALNHTNIIQYLDNGIHDRKPFIVMEYANGGNLEEWLHQWEGSPNIEDCLNLILQALHGLLYFHQLSPPVIHRDIKPSNIMLKKVGGRLIPKISDFGLAKPFQEVGGSVLSKIGEKKGTLAFMSVEQFINSRDVDVRTDIYAMGATLYYLLTTHLPYRIPSSFQKRELERKYSKDPQTLKAALKELGADQNAKDVILGTEVIHIQKRRPEIPDDLAKVIHKSLEKDINKRYQNSRVFLSDLEKVAVNLINMN